jgi:hypothetical protein
VIKNDRQHPWEGIPTEALDAIAPALPALVDEIIGAISAEVPGYARPLEGAFGKGVRLGVEQALGQFDQMARNPGVGRGVGREVYVALGRGEVRAGRSLDALLAAYRVGARVAWRRLAEAGLAAGVEPEALVLLAESIFAYIDELSAESAEGFAFEQAARAGETERKRADLIDLLVRTPPAPDDQLSAAAEEALWPLPRELALVVWRSEHGRGPAGRLPVGSISAEAEGVVRAVVADPLGPGRRDELARALSETPAGIGSTVPWREAARSHDRALAALELAEEREAPGAIHADDHRADLLVRANHALVVDIAADRLRPLAAETPLSRQRLEDTLLAWLRHSGGIQRAAEDLHVHPQTVRYRMTRLRELLGDALDDPDARFEIEIALRARATAPAAM